MYMIHTVDDALTVSMRQIHIEWNTWCKKRLCTWRSAHVEEPPHKKVAPVLKKYGVTQVPPDFCRICYYLCNYLVIIIYSNQPIGASLIQMQLVTQLVTFSVRLSTGRLQADG